MEASLLDRLLGVLQETVGDIFFIQIGAMDGVAFDPIRSHVLEHGWRGILVEPLKDQFVKLAHNYSDSINLVLENVAITEKKETRKIFRVPLSDIRSNALPDWTRGISSFYSDRNAIGGKHIPVELHERIKPWIIEEEVDCISLEMLLSSNNVEKVDFLQIDTEGYDYNILKQLDFSKFKPYIINMEYYLLPENEQRECINMLMKHGYRMVQSSAYDLAAVRWDWAEKNMGAVTNAND